jgi:hypothetical protein
VECRPKFTSVAAWWAQLRERSTLSIGFDLCENCYKNRELRTIAFLRYIDHCSYPPCRARTSHLVECRPKFTSVAAWWAQLRERSTLSIGFDLCENCYKNRELRI